MQYKGRVVGSYEEKTLSTCRVCNKEVEKRYTLTQERFVLFGLPLFPLKAKVQWSCKSCSVIKELKIKSTDTLDGFEQTIAHDLKVKYSAIKDVRNYWGTFFLLLLAGGIAYLIIKYS